MSSASAYNNLLTLGFSPCPNDTFIFYALLHNKINTEGLSFKAVLLDVETLNQKAFNSELDITKVSFNAYRSLRDEYSLLSAGNALGRGCGPLIIAKAETSTAALKGRKIAIPGRLTTAFLLLQLYEPVLAENVVVMPFNRIMSAIKNNEVEAGLIIHESRFTYQEYGLCEVIDLGKWWEADTGLPVPLGCIIARKSMGMECIQRVDSLIRESLEYAFEHREETMAYVKVHAQELTDKVIKQHIDLYVNAYSLSLGDEGLRAVEELFRRADRQKMIAGVKSGLIR